MNQLLWCRQCTLLISTLRLYRLPERLAAPVGVSKQNDYVFCSSGTQIKNTVVFLTCPSENKGSRKSEAATLGRIAGHHGNAPFTNIAVTSRDEEGARCTGSATLLRWAETEGRGPSTNPEPSPTATSASPVDPEERRSSRIGSGSAAAPQSRADCRSIRAHSDPDTKGACGSQFSIPHRVTRFRRRRRRS